MDINFPLVLVCAVFVTGVITLIDKYFWRKHRGPDAKEPLLIDLSRSFFPVLLLVLVLRSFVVEPFKIPSSSMVPTLLVNDFILVNKFTYGIRLPVIRTKIIDVSDPQRGDVMVFFPPHDDRYFIKRVVGLPGDEIRYINNVLYINGIEMKQELVAGIPPESPKSFIMTEDFGDEGGEHLMRKQMHPGSLSRHYRMVVPEGHYFMMGDNRDNSSDSRAWGAVPEENIVGKAFAIWMHWELKSLPKFDRNGKII